MYRKTGASSEVERYKCRFVAGGVRQIQGLHYHEKLTSTSAASSIKMVPATADENNQELRQLDVYQAFIQADIDKEMYIELPME